MYRWYVLVRYTLVLTISLRVIFILENTELGNFVSENGKVGALRSPMIILTIINLENDRSIAHLRITTPTLTSHSSFNNNEMICRQLCRERY